MLIAQYLGINRGPRGGHIDVVFPLVKSAKRCQIIAQVGNAVHVERIYPTASVFPHGLYPKIIVGRTNVLLCRDQCQVVRVNDCCTLSLFVSVARNGRSLLQNAIGAYFAKYFSGDDDGGQYHVQCSRPSVFN